MSSPKPKILFFAASLRRESHQKRLIAYLSARLANDCEIDILPDLNLPLFNQDLEKSDEILAAVKSVHKRFNDADAMIIASPEYNGHVSPYLKNTLDWVSRLARIDANYAAINPFRDKPALLCSASTGWTGGVLGLKDARSIFTYLGNLVVAEQICVSEANHFIEADTYKFEQGFADYIDKTLTNFISLVVRLQKGNAAINQQIPQLKGSTT